MKERLPFGLAVVLLVCLLTSITLFDKIHRQHEKSLALQKSTKSAKGLLESRSDSVGSDKNGFYSAFKTSNNNRPHIFGRELDFSSSVQTFDRMKFMISIHIIAFNRPRSLTVLLEQLDQANYDKATYGAIDLYVRIDFGAPEEVKAIANEFKWSKGFKYIVFSPAPEGVRGMWTHIEPRSPHEVLIIFEDDTRVSPYFLIWTLHLLKQYGGHGTSDRDPSIFGLSLSPLRLDEISYPFRPWNASKFLGDDQHVFLHAVPSSWGAVMFGDRWQDFLRFFAARTSDDLYNVSSEPSIAQGPDAPTLGDAGLAVPGSRSNVWPKSWKRFLIDYCYGRGLVTLYTHIPGSAAVGMATPLQLSGEHVVASRNSSLRVPSDYGGHHPTAAMHRNPRVGNLLTPDNETLWSDLTRRPLPPGAGLAVFDLWGRPTTRHRLQRQGRGFLTSVWARDPHKYAGVLHAWLGMPVSAGLVEEQDWKAALQQVWPDVAPAAEHGQAQEGLRERFLVYQPQFGFSNQRIALRNAAYWAACLNRTLIVPPAFLPRVTGGEWARAAGADPDDPDDDPDDDDSGAGLLARLVAMDQLFDLNGVDVAWCKARLRVTSLAEFMLGEAPPRGRPPEQVLAIHPPMSADQVSNRFFDALGWAAVPRVRGHADLCSDKLSRRVLLEEVGGMDDRILAVDGLFRCGPGDRSVHRDALLLRLQRPSPSAAAGLRKLAAVVLEGRGEGGCLCLQVRLGDFHQMCALEIPWMVRHRSNGLQCLVNASRLRAEVAAWPAGDCVQLLTNDERAALALASGAAAAGKSFVAQSAVMAALRQVSGSLPPALRLEQALDALCIMAEEYMCQQAPDAVVNAFSSLGTTVSLLRAHRNASTRFW